MKVILLAGGYVPVCRNILVSFPSLWWNWPIPHSVAYYEFVCLFGHKEFFVALGYKAHVVKEYFSKFYMVNSDFSVNLGTGELVALNNSTADWQVTLVDTGLDTRRAVASNVCVIMLAPRSSSY